MYSDDDDDYFAYDASSSSPPWLAKFTIGYVIFVTLITAPVIYIGQRLRKYFLLKSRQRRMDRGGPEHKSSIAKRLREKQESEAAAAAAGTYYEMTEVVRTGRHNIIVSGEAEISIQGDSASSLPGPSEVSTVATPASPAAATQSYNVIDIQYHGGGNLVRSRHRRAILEQALKNASPEKGRSEDLQEEEDGCLDCICVDSNTLGMLCAFDACLGDDGDYSDDEDILDNDSDGSVKDLATKDIHVAPNDYKSSQEHIENDDEIEGAFEGVEWGYLPSHVKEAAKNLGYSRRLWDVGGTVIAEKKLWDHLSNKEREAATTLGYNKVSSGVAKKRASSSLLMILMAVCLHPHFSLSFFGSKCIPLTSISTFHFGFIAHTAILGSQSPCYR